MHFKEWCLASYGISSISEGKVINRVFIPAKFGASFNLNQLVVYYGACFTTYQGRYGLTLTQDNYNQLLLQLRYQFLHLKDGYFDAEKFEIYKNQYLMDFDSENKVQYRIHPNVHLSFCGEKEKSDFLQRFASYHPFLSYDVLKQCDSVEISSFFLNELYEIYYQAPVSYKPSLKLIKENKLRLEKLVRQIEKNNLSVLLDRAQILALDYDNEGVREILTRNACTAYAMSLKIFAELHRFAFSLEDFRTLYSAANLLAAYDSHGELKQSLKMDMNFVHHITNELYKGYLISVNYDIRTKGFPLLAELPKEVFDHILSVIKSNIEDLLHGDHHAQYSNGLMRFLPNDQGYSDIDELIFQSGGMRGHSANFRLIKIGVRENGQQAELKEIPHHYEYFKVVNNLGINCHNIDLIAKTCLGTYVTRIMPCSYSPTDNSLVYDPINPFTHPKEYQKKMEYTLRALILNERLLKFYRYPAASAELTADVSPLGSKEAQEWSRLYAINQIISGVPYLGTLRYMAQDALNPARKYPCSVSNQRAYMQEGGSCSIFSLKSLASSVLDYDLATLHLSFMQQFNGPNCIVALKAKIALLDKTIKCLSPLIINGTSSEIALLAKEFKAYLMMKNYRTPFSVSSSLDKDSITLSTSFAKEQWFEFMRLRSQSNEKPCQNANGFFNQTKPPIQILQRPSPALRLSCP